MLIGYTRVSTENQKLDLQRDALAQLGCHRVFEDRASGARADRPGLAVALSHLRRGDTLVVWRLDRLGRTTHQLVNLLEQFEREGIRLRSLQDGIDPAFVMGKAGATPMSDAEIAMFESGWFGRSSAFWRWMETTEATPYVDAFTDMHRRPAADEPYDLLGEEETPDILDPDHLKKLAGGIETRFAGDGD